MPNTFYAIGGFTEFPTEMPSQAVKQSAMAETGMSPYDAEQQELLIARIAGQHPHSVVETLLREFSVGDLRSAAFCVSGADWKSPELTKLCSMLRDGSHQARWRTSYDTRQSLAVPEEALELSVSLKVDVEEALAVNVWQGEEVALRAAETLHGKIWRVVPEKPETIFAQPFSQSPDVGLVRRVATYLAYPRQTQLLMPLRESRWQMKQLISGLIQLAMRHGYRLQINADNFREKLQPFMASDAIFTAPGDEAGTQSYNFNPQLAEKSTHEIPAPFQKVAIYLGHDERFDFRFDGQTVIGLVEGNIQSMNAEQAKTLQWNPEAPAVRRHGCLIGRGTQSR